MNQTMTTNNEYWCSKIYPTIATSILFRRPTTTGDDGNVDDDIDDDGIDDNDDNDDVAIGACNSVVVMPFTKTLQYCLDDLSSMVFFTKVQYPDLLILDRVK